MADTKKYYYLKLKDNFFDSEEMIILQDMKNGYLYSDILIKLYLKSLKNGGKLMFNESTPYTTSMLAKIVGHKENVVIKALEVFKNLDLIQILENGAIYMLKIQNYIGKSTTEADRKREYRSQIEEEKRTISGQMSGQMSAQMSDKYPPENRDKRIEIREQRLETRDKHINLKENNINNIIIPPFFDSVWKDIILLYPRRKGLEEECKVKYYEMLEEYENKEEIIEDTQAVITNYVERYDKEHPDDIERKYLISFKRFFDEKFIEELQNYRKQKTVFTGWRESNKVLGETELSKVHEFKFDHSGLEQYDEVLKEIYRTYPVHRYMHTAYESLYFSIVNNYEDATGANLLYASVGKYLEEMKNRKQYYIPDLGYWLKYEAVKVMETITEFKKLIS